VTTGGTAIEPQHAELRARLYERFRGSSTPVLMGPGFGIPGASLWSGSRAWIAWLRDSGVERGSRVLVALPVCPASVMLTIACWWEAFELIVAPSEVEDGTEFDVKAFGAAIAVGTYPGKGWTVPGVDHVPLAGPVRVAAERYLGGTVHRAVSWASGGRPWTCSDVMSAVQDAAVPAHVVMPSTWHRPAECRRLWAALWHGEVVEVERRAEHPCMEAEGTQPWGGARADLR
jgi:hypothetical protein